MGNPWASISGRHSLARTIARWWTVTSRCRSRKFSLLKALQGAGIDIVAIHQHMAGEAPRIIFLHYWGVGSTDSLARGLRTALDEKRSGAAELGGREMKWVTRENVHVDGLGFKNDQELKAAEWIVYDALYGYGQQVVHNGKLEGGSVPLRDA